MILSEPIIRHCPIISMLDVRKQSDVSQCVKEETHCKSKHLEPKFVFGVIDCVISSHHDPNRDEKIRMDETDNVTLKAIVPQSHAEKYCYQIPSK